MYLSNQSLLVILIVGIVTGWLAGRVMEGGGFGLIGDLIVGLIGAFIGDWLLPRLGIHLGTGSRPQRLHRGRRASPAASARRRRLGASALGETLVAWQRLDHGAQLTSRVFDAPRYLCRQSLVKVPRLSDCRRCSPLHRAVIG
jgi:uncharacterized membrane protein YeaQ/YmgE (transglycosylase-associated protein family)